jgi:hypothetical protein
VLEIERLTTRIHAVTQAIRTNALYDAALGLQIEGLMIGDLKMIPVINWPSYKSRGGLQAGVEFMDVAPYVAALQTLQAARQTALEQLYETLKVSDLLRGTSEQYKSATANRLESQWSSLGLIVRQNMFCKFISDAIAKLGAIVASQFEAETIFEVASANALIAPLLPPPPEPPAPEMGPDGQPMPMMPQPPYDPMPLIETFKQQVLDLFRNEDKFNYRIEVASDSMVAIDQQQSQADGARLMETCGAFFDQMRSLIEQYPPLLEFSIELFKNVIKRFKGGKELDGIFTKALGQIGEIAKAKEEAAKQPPPPDPKMQEMQGRMQIAQIEAQARLQVSQIESQDIQSRNFIAGQEMQMKMQREQLDAQLAMQKAQLEQYIAEQELALKQQELQIKASAVQVDMAKAQALATSEQMKNEIKSESVRLGGLLEVQKLESQQMQFKLSQQEKLMEERRLAAEQQLDQVRMQLESFKTASVQDGSKSNPIVINNIIPKASKKLGTIGTDEMGNTTLSIDNIEE